ncbi:MAG: ribosome silencing factor [Chloroflexi bacterium]|nr:ribosome silencing factor [Chloroflexota bacterium]
MNTLELAHTIVEALEDKKGENIILMDLEKVAMFTSYFVICNGTSDRMLAALADGVVDQVRETYGIKGVSQGQAASGWVLVDFGSVIVHCFAPETREFFKLEELWREGKILLHVQ